MSPAPCARCKGRRHVETPDGWFECPDCFGTGEGPEDDEPEETRDVYTLGQSMPVRVVIAGGHRGAVALERAKKNPR